MDADSQTRGGLDPLHPRFLAGKVDPTSKPKTNSKTKFFIWF